MSARESIAEALEKFQKAFEHAMDPNCVDLAREKYQADCSLHFTQAYLLELLRRQDEVLADRAAEWLAGCGEVMAEVVGEWRWQLLTGRAMSTGCAMSMPDLTEETS